jgi:putative NIF3 family GTP cyclohydrolase 1 type 2
MKLSNIISILEEMAPIAYAEDFDNVGLLTGDTQQEISGILVCHDALETVVEEAIENNCNLIVCFSSYYFFGIEKITGKNYVEKAVIKSIRNDIVIYTFTRLWTITKMV